MNIKHTALAVLLAISLGGNLSVAAKKATEAGGATAEQTASTSETGKSSTKTAHKKKSHEKKGKAEATSGGPGSTGEETGTKKSNPLYRLFAPLETKNKTESSKTTTSKKLGMLGNHEGQVYVHGYTTKTGKHVEGYWRKKPGQG